MTVDYIKPLKFIALVIGRRCKMNEVLLCLVTHDSHNCSCSSSDWSGNNTDCERLETPARKSYNITKFSMFEKLKREGGNL